MKTILISLALLISTHLLFSQEIMWEKQNPKIAWGTLNDVFVVDSLNVYAVGDSGAIIKTTDGGEKWILKNSGTIANLKDIQFIGDSLGWIVGEYGVILKTTDKGENWFQLQSKTFKNLNSLCFTDRNNGWAVGDSLVIINTTNGGNSWNYQNIDTVLDNPGSMYYCNFFDSSSA